MRPISYSSSRFSGGPSRLLAGLACLAFGSLACGSAAEVSSPVSGFLRFRCPAGSDTVVSVPFHQAPRWTGALSTAPTEEDGSVRLDLAGSPGFAAKELVDLPHFLRCDDGSGPLGRHFAITGHGAGHLLVAASLADLDGLGAGDRLSVIPTWTLDGLFPPATQTTFHRSAGRLASERGSELLLFDRETPGSDLAPSHRYFVTADGWFEAGSLAKAGKTAIAPGEAFLIRHSPGAAATEFIPSRQVHAGPVSLAVGVAVGKARDTMLALPRPLRLRLDQLDFGAGAFEDSPTTDPTDRKDQLLVFDNAVAERNKAASAIYFRSGGAWVEDAPGFPPAGAVEIEPAAGLLVRKAAGNAELRVRWTNAPTYDATHP